MRVALRADASATIGTGHVMRQIALSQSLLTVGIETVLIGSIPGPQWLIDYVAKQDGLVWEQAVEGDFDPSLFCNRGFGSVVIDSYQLSQADLDSIEAVIPRVVVMVDGPWQELSGSIAVSGSFFAEPSWATDFRRHFSEFYCGPEFFLLRKEVIVARAKKKSMGHGGPPRIVVALGGTDLGRRTSEVLNAIGLSDLRVHVDVFVPDPSGLDRYEGRVGQIFEFHRSSLSFVDYLAAADLSITAAGTTVAEISFLGTDAIFVSVAENQQENARAIRELGIGAVVDSREGNLEMILKDYIRDALSSTKQPRRGARTRELVDGGGAERVARILLCGEGASPTSALR